MHNPPPVHELLVELAAFPERLQERIVAAAPPAWHHRPTDEDWSLTELVCHLRDVEREVHQPRFRALISQDNAFIAGADPDRWTAERVYQDEDGAAALTVFAAARQQTLALLQPLSEAMWQRRGRHAFFGPTSMHELLNLVVQHDHAHWEQVQKLLGLR